MWICIDNELYNWTGCKSVDIAFTIQQELNGVPIIRASLFIR